MSKIKFETLTEAVIKTNNSVDDERVYNISANVRITDSTHVNNIDGGRVDKDGKVVCTFSTYAQGQLNTNFQNVNDVMEMCGILQAINSFVVEVTEEVANGTVVAIE